MKKKVLVSILGWEILILIVLCFVAIWGESSIWRKLIYTDLLTFFITLVVGRLLIGDDASLPKTAEETKSRFRAKLEKLQEERSKEKKYTAGETSIEIPGSLSVETEEQRLDRLYLERYGKPREKN